jgi:predicted MFS family arabinose efflux permease
VYTIAACAWPLVLTSFARNEWDSGALVERPVMWICTLWVMFVFALDLFLLDRTPNQEIESIDKKKSEYLTTSNVLIGAVFTFGVLLSHVHNRRSSRAAMITLTSLLLSILFVLPVFDIDNVDPISFIFMACIKVACIYSVGLFIVAVALEVTGSAARENSSNALANAQEAQAQ